MPVELIEVISDKAIEYLVEVDEKFKGKLSRAWKEEDYLTDPEVKSKFYQGYNECLDKKLLAQHRGFHGEFIKYSITNKGYEVLKKFRENG